jgi:purine-cytosine permease-like protein
MGGIWSGITDTTNALVIFFATLTDYTMWRSIGWLLLGTILIGAGLAMFARDSAVSGLRAAVR